MEVKFMTLSEKYREAFEEGRKQVRRETILKLYSKGFSIGYIAEINEFKVKYVRYVVKKYN